MPRFVVTLLGGLALTFGLHRFAATLIGVAIGVAAMFLTNLLQQRTAQAPPQAT